MDNEKLFILFYIIGMLAVFLPLIFYNSWKLDKEWAKFHTPMTKEDEEECMKLEAFSCLLDLRNIFGIDYEYNEDQKKLGKSLINDLFKDNEDNDKVYELLFDYTPSSDDSTNSEVDKWIPCTEKMPDNNKLVYVTDCNGMVYIRKFDGYCWWDEFEEYDSSKEYIIAWMPYVEPEPYKVKI